MSQLAKRLMVQCGILQIRVTMSSVGRIIPKPYCSSGRYSLMTKITLQLLLSFMSHLHIPNEEDDEENTL